jgi:hypothetical protein
LTLDRIRVLSTRASSRLAAATSSQESKDNAERQPIHQMPQQAQPRHGVEGEHIHTESCRHDQQPAQDPPHHAVAQPEQRSRHDLRSPNPGLVPVLVRRADGKPVSVHEVWNAVPKDEVFAEFEPNERHEVSCALDLSGDPPPFQIRTVDGLVNLIGLEVGGLLDYTERELPISRVYEYVDASGALVQTAEVEVVHEGARLVFGLNATPDRTRHSVTVRRDNDSGPDVIHVQMSGTYEGVIDQT